METRSHRSHCTLGVHNRGTKQLSWCSIFCVFLILLPALSIESQFDSCYLDFSSCTIVYTPTKWQAVSHFAFKCDSSKLFRRVSFVTCHSCTAAILQMYVSGLMSSPAQPPFHLLRNYRRWVAARA